MSCLIATSLWRFDRTKNLTDSEMLKTAVEQTPKVYPKSGAGNSVAGTGLETFLLVVRSGQ